MCSPPRMPAGDEPLVVTGGGSPAWLAGEGLFAVSASGLVQLDHGAITGLVADGGTVRWLNGGEPRSAGLD